MATNNDINWNKPLPLFKCYPSAFINDITGDGSVYDIVFNTVNFDTTSSLTNGVYKIPVSGRYKILSSITFRNLSASHTSGSLSIYNKTLATSLNISLFAPRYLYATSGNGSTAIVSILDLTKDHEINMQLMISGGTKTIDIQPTFNSMFCGFLINQ